MNYKADCKACGGTGIRDIWVIDGWSVTDCLCGSGWTYDEMSGWKEPQQGQSQPDTEGKSA